MTTSITAIASNTVVGTAASITFSSIPGTYTDLKLLISGRSLETGNTDGIGLTFNGSTANQTGIMIFFNSNTGGAINSSNSVGAQEGGWINGVSSTTSNFSNNEIYIANYTSTSNGKSFLVDTVQEKNATGTNAMYMGMHGLIWNPGTSVAITSITLSPGGGNFIADTTATLFGIKNS